MPLILLASFSRRTVICPQNEPSVRDQVAPCGLACAKCVAYADGEIARLATRLGELLGDNFGAYAERFAHMNPVFENYPQFRELLDYMAEGSCTNCRDKGCLFKACQVTTCVRDRGVDYCFQCDEFPCDRHGMPEALAARWKANNEAMRDKGIDSFHVEIMSKPRYP